MKLLVTGGTGMLGQAIVRKYHTQHSIRFLGRNQVIGKQLASSTHSEFVCADLQQQALLLDACQDIDAVIHCAALSSPWGKHRDFVLSNVEGTENILQAATQSKVKRFVHISTPSVYFNFQDKMMIKEEESLGPVFCNDYAQTKAWAEKKVLNSALNTVILRPRGIFGPYDQAILPRILAVIRHGILWLPSGRNPIVDLTYVDNVADAALLSAEQPVASKSVFNITNDEPMPMQTVLQNLFSTLQQTVQIKTLPYPLIAPIIRMNEWCCRKLPTLPEPKLTRYTAALFHYHQTLDITKAKNQLGYQPQVSIKEGIQRYAQWYQHQAV